MVMNWEKIDQIIETRTKSGGSALAVLSDIQKEFRYIPEEAFEYIADRMSAEKDGRVSAEQLRRQAEFFHIFSTKSNGRHVIHICNGPCCTARGRQAIIEVIKKETGLRDGEVTTEDGRFSLLPSGCMQGCASGPIVVIDGDRHEHVTADNIMEILQKYE